MSPRPHDHADGLVASLDGPADADAERAWAAEIRRRIAEIDCGTAELIGQDELRRRMLARVSGS